MAVVASGRWFHEPTVFVDCDPHRIGDPVGVKNRLAPQIARRTSNRLDQRTCRTQEPFLVGIEDRDQRHFGHVQPFAQQVDTDEHVELA